MNCARKNLELRFGCGLCDASADTDMSSAFQQPLFTYTLRASSGESPIVSGYQLGSTDVVHGRHYRHPSARTVLGIIFMRAELGRQCTHDDSPSTNFKRVRRTLRILRLVPTDFQGQKLTDRMNSDLEKISN